MRPPTRAIVALGVAVATLVPARASLAAPSWSVVPSPSASSAQQRAAAEGSGTATLVWQQSTSAGTELWTARRTGPSGAVSSPVRLSAAAGAGQGITADEPALAANASGLAVAAWTARLPGSTRTVIAMSARASGAAAWSTPVTMSDATYPASSPTIALDAAGQAILAWQQGSADYTQVRVEAVDPSTFAASSPATISSNAGHLAQPRLAASAQGSAYLAYVETAVSFSPPYTGAVTLRAATRAPGAAAFGTASQVVKLNSANVTDLQLVADEAGTATVAWAQPDSSTGAPGGAWASTHLAGTTTWPGLRLGTTSGASPSIATSQAGGAALAWIEPPTGTAGTDGIGTVNVARRAPGTTNWKATPNVALTGSGESALSPAAGMSPNGTIVVAWTSRTNGGDQARQSVWTAGNANPWPAADLGAPGGTLAGASVVVDERAGLATWLRTTGSTTVSFLGSLDMSTAAGTPPTPTPTPTPATPTPTASATPTPTPVPGTTATPTPAPGTTTTPTPAPGTTTTPTPAPGTTATPTPTPAPGTTTTPTVRPASTPTPAGATVRPVATPTPAAGATAKPATTPTPAAKGSSVAVGAPTGVSTTVGTSTPLGGAATFTAFRALGKKRFAHGDCSRPLVAGGAGLPLELTTTQAGTMRFVVTATPKGGRARNLTPAISLAVSPGATRTVFTGCLAGKALRRGRYKLKVIYSDAGGTVRGRRALPFVISR